MCLIASVGRKVIFLKTHNLRDDSQRTTITHLCYNFIVSPLKLNNYATPLWNNNRLDSFFIFSNEHLM